jgi:hypothetical protein
MVELSGKKWEIVGNCGDSCENGSSVVYFVGVSKVAPQDSINIPR